MPFVFRINDESLPVDFEDIHVGDVCGAPRPWVQGGSHVRGDTVSRRRPGFSVPPIWCSTLRITVSTLGSETTLDGDCLVYAFKIAQPGESSLFHCPVNRLQTLDEAVPAHRAS